MLKAGDIVEYGTELFGNKPATWRVNSYMKSVIYDENYILASSCVDNVMQEIVFEEYRTELDERIASGFTRLTKIRLVYCTAEEADYVTLSGICGAIASVSECKKVGVANWPSERIKQSHEDALSYIDDNDVHPCYKWI